MFCNTNYLQENDSKRARALKKASEEREMKRGKEREISRSDELLYSMCQISHKLCISVHQSTTDLWSNSQSV